MDQYFITICVNLWEHKKFPFDTTSLLLATINFILPIANCQFKK